MLELGQTQTQIKTRIPSEYRCDSIEFIYRCGSIGILDWIRTTRERNTIEERGYAGVWFSVAANFGIGLHVGIIPLNGNPLNSISHIFLNSHTPDV